jgi:hypothetical protein
MVKALFRELVSISLEVVVYISKEVHADRVFFDYRIFGLSKINCERKRYSEVIVGQREVILIGQV